MTYYDKIVENPDAALDDIAARRGLTRDEMAQRLIDIRRAAGEGSHLTLSQAQQFLDAEVPLAGVLRSHADSCAYCQALVDAVQPDAVAAAVLKAQEAIFPRGTTQSFIRARSMSKRMGWIPTYLFRPIPAFVTVALVSLAAGMLLTLTLGTGHDPMFGSVAPHTASMASVSIATTVAYEGVREAFSEGQPAVGYQRLTAVLKQSGLPEQKLAPVRHLKTVVEKPIPDEAREEVLSEVLDRGRPIDVAKIRDAEQAEKAMTTFAQIGDHPRALAALQVYLTQSNASNILRAGYSANVDTLAVAAAQASIEPTRAHFESAVPRKEIDSGK